MIFSTATLFAVLLSVSNAAPALFAGGNQMLSAVIGDNFSGGAQGNQINVGPAREAWVFRLASLTTRQLQHIK